MTALIAAVAALSCGGEGNTGRPVYDPELVKAVPWLNGVSPAVVNGAPFVPEVPVYPPIATGIPDPGSQHYDCRALEGIELSEPLLNDFESENPADPGFVGAAGMWSAFDDLSRYSFHAPGEINWYQGLKGRFSGAGWGMPAYPMAAPSCDGKPNNWVLHYRGGLFRQWGGGMSHIFDDVGCTGMDFCQPPLSPDAKFDRAGIPVRNNALNLDYAQSHSSIDASSYEGVAFWARRGPEGQDRLLVTITDSFTSDRLARENQTFCRRIKACRSQCLNGEPCSPAELKNPFDPTSAPIYRCFDPQKVKLSAAASNGVAAPVEAQDLMYPRCGPSACSSPDTYQDRDFDGKSCRPYTQPGGDESAEYCWNEGDPAPPSRDEKCLAGWQGTVQLNPDWQFYTIPFSEMLQGEYGKKAPYFNTKAIDTIALSFIVGWVDVYIDNVTLYRRKK